MQQFAMAGFWLALGNIILVNIVLSGDNAIVIALAARSLPPAQQRKAILYGSAAAIVLRIILTLFAVTLLTLPYLKIVGAVLLFYIGAQLLSEGDDGDANVHQHSTLAHAVRTILVADLVMSLDNVLGVAAAAKGDMTLLIAGLVISIPLIVFGSGIILKLMERAPVIITLGAALLGYLAGEMLFSDAALQPWIAGHMAQHELHLPGTSASLSMPGLLLAVAVVLTGRWMAARSRSAQ